MNTTKPLFLVFLNTNSDKICEGVQTNFDQVIKKVEILRKKDKLDQENKATHLYQSSDVMCPEIKFTMMMDYIIESEGFERVIELNDNVFIMMIEDKGDSFDLKVSTTKIADQSEFKYLMIRIMLRFRIPIEVAVSTMVAMIHEDRG